MATKLATSANPTGAPSQTNAGPKVGSAKRSNLNKQVNACKEISARSNLATITPLFRASAAARALLATCDNELAAAAVALDPAHRYIAAHIAAVRAASAYVDLVGSAPKRVKKSVWEQLVAIDPVWVPWAAFFSAGTRTRRAVEMGIPVAIATADEMTAFAEDFRDEIAMAIDPSCEWPQDESPQLTLLQAQVA